MTKRCKFCGASLDPGEWRECESERNGCEDPIRRATARHKTTFPREWVPESYTKAKYQNGDKP